MIGLCLILILLWLAIVFLTVRFSMERIGRQQAQSLEARGYAYGSVAPQYSFIPFVEPMLILAGVAFLAFLIQTFQAIFMANQPQQSPSLVGGLVDSLVPTRHRTLNYVDETNYRSIVDAIKVLKLIEGSKGAREPEWMDRLREDTQGSTLHEISDTPPSTSQPDMMVPFSKNPMRRR